MSIINSVFFLGYLASGDQSYYDDGAMETIEADVGEVITEDYGTEDYFDNETSTEDVFDPLGCPIAMMTDRSAERKKA